jgi:hypothetical protein
VSDSPSITPDGIDEPTTHELLAQLICRVESLTAVVEATHEAVVQVRSEVSHVRHAVAVVADGELDRRRSQQMLVERMDVLESEGCARRRLHGGNGAAE